ncbi:hypothetical protein ACKVMT_15135 [Halobacteriales archaeon Cl-PHB]
MSETDMRKVLFGAVLLVAGTAIIFGLSGSGAAGLPVALGSLAALGLAAGALLLGTSEPGRPV